MAHEGLVHVDKRVRYMSFRVKHVGIYRPESDIGNYMLGSKLEPWHVQSRAELAQKLSERPVANFLHIALALGEDADREERGHYYQGDILVAEVAQ